MRPISDMLKSRHLQNIQMDMFHSVSLIYKMGCHCLLHKVAGEMT